MCSLWLVVFAFFVLGFGGLDPALRIRPWALASFDSAGRASKPNYLGRSKGGNSGDGGGYGRILSKHDHHDHGLGPYFEDETNATLTTVHVGGSVHLNCRVGMLHDKVVMWLRQVEDRLQLLTLAETTHISDPRFSLHFKYPNNWRLRIKEVHLQDAGIYACEVSTHPPKVLYRNLHVLAPEMHIVDERGYDVLDRYLRAGSTIELTCIVRHVDTSTHHVTWKKDDKPLRVKSDAVEEAFVSQITIPNAQRSDSGVYSCSVSKYSFVSATIHVLDGETQAAIQTEQAGGCQCCCSNPFLHLQCFLLLIAATSLLQRR